MNFESALTAMREAQGLFESNEYPRDTGVAAARLRGTRVVLQNFNSGAAAASISAAQEQIELVAQQLDRVSHPRRIEFDEDEG